MNDQSKVCSDWSDRKLVEAADAQIALAVGAPTAGLRLGHYASARALLGILCERAQADAKPSPT